MCLICFGEKLISQDAIYGQFDSKDILLNPANNTLNFQSSYKGMINVRYRDQWRALQPEAGFQTASVTANYKVYDNHLDQWHMGMIFFNDNSDNRTLNQTMFQASSSYTRKIFGMQGTKTKSMYLSAGVALSYNQLSNKNTKLWFGRQFNNDISAIDFSLPSGENFVIEKNTFLSITGGIRWIYLHGKKRSFSSGLSLHHLNNPQIGFFENQQSLQHRINFYFDAEIPLNSMIQQNASILFSVQNPSFQMIPAYKLKFLINDEDSSMNIGLASRISKGSNSMTFDAFILQFGLEITRWAARLSYEMNVSSLSQFDSANGAIELSVNYFLP